ncbi:hypothetical protein E2C01_018687 [Portunus trituberculatus]|uniref:Uncharacterized protein n=1 Tax=Portunus trituberculatus TaxID=210409 RepID=A0A5B7DWV8_PORTR|nr:hypothetical protein [Portunus trituberculatus]
MEEHDACLPETHTEHDSRYKHNKELVQRSNITLYPPPLAPEWRGQHPLAHGCCMMNSSITTTRVHEVSTTHCIIPDLPLMSCPHRVPPQWSLNKDTV